MSRVYNNDIVLNSAVNFNSFLNGIVNQEYRREPFNIRQRRRFSRRERHLYDILLNKSNTDYNDILEYKYNYLRKSKLKKAVRKLRPEEHITQNDLIIYKLAGLVSFTAKNLKNTINDININRQNGTSRIKITGNKQTLIDRLEEHYGITERIEKIRNSIIFITAKLRKYKNRKILYSWQADNKAYHDRSLCVNDDDPIICEELKDIEDIYFYVIKEGKYYYGFDIRTIFSIILLGRKNQNPLTRKTFSRIVYKDCLVFFERLKHQKKSIFFEDEEENEIVENTVESRRQQNIRLANTISCILHEFGYYITEDDIFNISSVGLMRSYTAIYNIWHQNMTYELRNRFNVNHQIHIQHPNVFIEHRNKLNMILTIFNQLITLPQCINDKKMGALYVMISLAYGSQSISNRFPYLQNIFEN